MSSGEGWTDLMWASVDSQGIDMQPIYGNKPAWALFFMLFQLFGSLFIMNLFVGVVINTFNDEKERLGKNHLLTEVQKEWVMIQIACMKVKPLKQIETIHANKFRNIISKIERSFAFEIVILVCIVLNTAVLAIEWYN